MNSPSRCSGRPTLPGAGTIRLERDFNHPARRPDTSPVLEEKKARTAAPFARPASSSANDQMFVSPRERETQSTPPAGYGRIDGAFPGNRQPFGRSPRERAIRQRRLTPCPLSRDFPAVGDRRKRHRSLSIPIAFNSRAGCGERGREGASDSRNRWGPRTVNAMASPLGAIAASLSKCGALVMSSWLDPACSDRQHGQAWRLCVGGQSRNHQGP